MEKQVQVVIQNETALKSFEYYNYSLILFMVSKVQDSQPHTCRHLCKVTIVFLPRS